MNLHQQWRQRTRRGHKVLKSTSKRKSVSSIWEVGPPWTLTSSGGSPPGGATKSCTCEEQAQCQHELGGGGPADLHQRRRQRARWRHKVLKSTSKQKFVSRSWEVGSAWTLTEGSGGGPGGATKSCTSEEPLPSACLVPWRVEVHECGQAALCGELNGPRLRQVPWVHLASS